MGDLQNLGNAISGAAKQVVDTGTQVIVTTVQVAVAPAKAAIEVAQGKALGDVASDVQNTIVDHVTAVAAAAKLPNFVIIDTVRAVAGDGAANIAIASTAGTVVPIDFLARLAQKLGRPGLKIDDLATLPLDSVLATALDSASQQLSGGASPIPDLVKYALKGHYSPDILEEAKYIVGKVGLTLPQVVNGFQTFMGNHAYAVTVPGVIVFSVEPGQTKEALHWWAHELQHIVQYKKMGVDAFASAYIREYQNLENEADIKAKELDL